MKTLILLILLSTALQAQEMVSLSVHQDSRLAFTGDDRGNDAGTINLMLRFKMQGNQDKLGYFIVFPEFEYAELQVLYKRWSANVGYTLNQLGFWDNRVELTSTLGFGYIDREGATVHSFSGSFEVAYRLSHRFKLSFVGQLTERRDLALWGVDIGHRYSGFMGIEVNLN